MADVSAFVSFVKKFFVQTSVPHPLSPSDPIISQYRTCATYVRKAKLTEVMLCKVSFLCSCVPPASPNHSPDHILCAH